MPLPLPRAARWLPVLFAVGLGACLRSEPSPSPIGDAENGRRLLGAYGCSSCHLIPGVPGARAHVGPPLERFARRRFVGGRSNAPNLVVEFITHPRAVRADTPMPDLGVTERDARDMAAYLYGLR